ncbi:hypothetical protein N1851_015178 [Merluccius polli]|uniref:HAT C-terminal dimerisation domain-containing protein n=1 Tax=Merluccius polli TaxID=89951 RepID=A0AA47MSM7_MERPO|nr:hypothetical protein N1851_015178 [Merluccius polli]
MEMQITAQSRSRKNHKLHSPIEEKSTALDQLFGETYEVRTAKRSFREKVTEEILRLRERNLLPLLNGQSTGVVESTSGLYPLACQILQKVPLHTSTSVAAERVFSTAGDIISSHRSLLRRDPCRSTDFSEEES